MPSTPMPMTAPPDVYRRRRAQFAKQLACPVLLAAGRFRPRQVPTNPHPFRAGSHYLYFVGPPLEGAALILEPSSDGIAGCWLLRPESSHEDAVWVGETPGDSELAAASGLAPRSIRATDDLRGILGGRNAAYLAPPCIPTIDWLKNAGIAPAGDDVKRAIVDMRLVKDEHEIAAIRKAVRATGVAYQAAFRGAAPGRKEAEVAALFHAALQSIGFRAAFTPIITVRGEVLHLEGHPNTLRDGNLLLIDGGAEEPGGYAADVTRTIPVSGQFTQTQATLYNIVLRAEREAIAACVPGRRYRDIHDVAAKCIIEGLVDADMLRGGVDALFDRRAHTLFFPHGVGHLLGLDVHDMEDFGDLAGYAPGRVRRTFFGDKYLRLDRDLAPGMVVTIEPGIYLIPAVWRTEALSAPFSDVVNRRAVDALLHAGFGGIRIEDDVHVRPAAEGGPEVLTSDIPASIDELTGIIGKA